MAKTLLQLIEESKNPCQVCKKWEACLYGKGKDWYEYFEIRYCWYQVIWIIVYADTLLRGDWPPKPEGSCYIDPAIHTGYASEAYYVKPVVILAEVNKRLSKAGVHGKLLRAEIIAGLDLSEESKSALKYCSGQKGKQMSYNAWKKWNKLYSKVK